MVSCETPPDAKKRGFWRRNEMIAGESYSLWQKNGFPPAPFSKKAIGIRTGFDESSNAPQIGEENAIIPLQPGARY